MSKYRAVFPDRLPPKDGILPLNFMAARTVIDLPLEQVVEASDKRAAYHKVKSMHPYERVIIEDFKE